MTTVAAPQLTAAQRSLSDMVRTGRLTPAQAQEAERLSAGWDVKGNLVHMAAVKAITAGSGFQVSKRPQQKKTKKAPKKA